MRAQPVGFLQVFFRARWVVAVVASLSLHLAANALLTTFISVDGALGLHAEPPIARFTVNIIPSTGKEGAPAKIFVPSSGKGAAANDELHQQERKKVSSSARLTIFSGYFSVSELEVIPVIRHDINIFPSVLKSFHGKGKVVIGLWIDESGRVVRAEPIATELPQSDAEIAAEAFLKADFQPGMKNGKPVKSMVKVVMTYSSP